jgi:arylsulfatase A
MSIKRLGFLLSVMLALGGGSGAATPARPNIILINCDDLGYGDIAPYGATDIRTPHLDRMAREGLLLTDFSVTAPLCTPSRASLMTGKYPGRVGLATGVLRPDATRGLPGEEITLAEVLKASGYTTACIGKWHLGFVPGMRPRDQGFDHYYGVLHNLDKWETVYFDEVGGMPIHRNETVVSRPAVPAEITGLYTAEALAFIEQHQAEPFFLYLGHAMPHIPFDASPRFKGKSPRGLYGDAVEELDDSTGQILDRLRELDLAAHTLVIFTSDNGPERNTPGTAAPLQGTKHTVFEGGLRVPFLAWWPGHIPAGQSRAAFVTALDLLPTFAALGGVETLPAGLDGVDRSAVLLAPASEPPPPPALYSRYGNGPRAKESMRVGPWKLHLLAAPQLYDLTTDLGEATNVAAQNPTVVANLTDAAVAIRTATHADRAWPKSTPPSPASP